MPKLNKPAIPGYTYASAEQTSGKSYAPHLKERVIDSQIADLDRIKKGLDTSETRPQNRAQVQNAAGKAILRTLGRTGYASAALEGGYELGRDIDEATGVGKTMVDKSGLGNLAEKVATPKDKVELSQESKDRIARGDLDKKFAKPSKISSSESTRAGSSPDDDIGKPKEPSSEAMRRGGKVRSHASKRGDGIAQRGHTKGRYM